MAKSRARFLSELLGTTGLVKKSKSALAGADEVIDLSTLPSIPNSKLTNSSITINSSATSLGGSVTLTTANVAENTNLYYTDARADARIAAADTGDLSEGSNLYYTDARADARVNLQTGSNLNLSSKDTGDLSEGSNLYYTNARADARIAAASTSDLSEGSNLYYTNARADARIAAASTSDLSEGTNLYYTDARADARVALIVDSAPGTLNTLNELAAALGDDANFSTTVTNSIATKLPLAGGTLTGTLTVDAGSSGMIDFGNVTTAYGRLYADNSGTFIGSKSNHPLILRTNHTTALTLDTSQNATFAGTISSGAITSTGILTLDTSPAANGVGDLVIIPSLSSSSGVGFAGQVFGVNVKNAVHSTHNAPQVSSTWGGVTGATAIAIQADDNSYGQFQVWTAAQDSSADDLLVPRFYIGGSGAATFTGTLTSGAITTNNNFNMTGGYSIYLGSTSRFSSDNNGSFGINYGTTGGSSTGSLVIYNNTTATSQLNRNGTIASNINGNNIVGGNIVLGPSSGSSKWYAITGRQYDSSTETEGYSLITGATASGVNDVTIGGGLDEQNAATKVMIKVAANSTTRNGTEVVRVTTSGLDVRNNVLKITGTTVIDANRQIFAKGNTQVGEDGTYGGYGVLGFGGITNGYNRVFGRDDTNDGLFLAAGTGRNVFVRSNGEGSDSITLGTDGTYSSYKAIGFGSTVTNGGNKIFATPNTNDGLYICAATGRDIIFRPNGSGVDAFKITSAGNFQVGTTIVIDASRNLTNIGTISSGAITSTGDISANSGKVRMGNPTLLSGRSSIRIDSNGDSFADLVFGDNVTSTGWTNANWAISSRSSSESNSLKIFRATGQPSPYNSEHVLMEFKQNNVVSVNSTLQINNTTVIDSSRNLTNIGTISSGAITATAGIYSNSIKGLSTTLFTQGTAGTRKLGTFFCGQSGQTILITYIGGTGYNAQNYQNGRLYIQFRTSNNSSSVTSSDTGASAFYGSGHWWAKGRGTIASAIQVKQVSATQYEFYITGASFAGNGSVTAKCDHGSRWESTMQDATLSGTYLTLPEENRSLTEIYAPTFTSDAYKIGTTVVINSNRDLTNIGTISSGAITSSGEIAGTNYKVGTTQIVTSGRSIQNIVNYSGTGEIQISGNLQSTHVYNSGSYYVLNTAGNGWNTVVDRGNGNNFTVNSLGGFLIDSTTVLDSNRVLQNVTLGHSNTGARFEKDDWMYDTGGKARFYFEGGGRTFFGSDNGFIYRDNTDTGRATISNNGGLNLLSGGDGQVGSTVALAVSGTTVIDSSRNLIIGAQINFNGATNSSFIGAASTVNLRYAADGYHRFDTYNGGWGERVQITDTGCHPATDNTYDLGTTVLRWRNVYTTDLHLSNEGKPEGNEVDGTTGNWTIQEGDENLYILNNKTGKKYKFALEEIT